MKPKTCKQRIQIKPLSVNQAWQGKRFKTSKYKSYEKEILLRLKPMEIPKGKIQILIDFGVSSTLADVDNPAKLFIDLLSKKYGFNDKLVYRLELNKVDVQKGAEYIEFEITEYAETR
jgi:Holliday junction resolvase RusA-like endonuclease